MRIETSTVTTRGRRLVASEYWMNGSELEQGYVLAQRLEGAGEQEQKRPELPRVDEVTFRAALGAFCSGVTIVTFHLDGCFYGLTVSSFCSLSLSPPLILTCISRHCQSHDLLGKARGFAVNILAENGEWLARQFAGKAKDRFADVPHHLGQFGSPLLDDALAAVECILIDQIPSGDHSIFVGGVMSARVCDDTRPLVYYRSRFYQGITAEER